MGAWACDITAVRALIERVHAAPPGELRLQHRPLRGGLEAAAVTHVVARYRDARDRPRTFTFIVKHVVGAASREALVYQHLVTRHAGDFSPRLLALERPARGHAVLYLEAVTRRNAWPWRDLHAAQAVLSGAAQLHATVPHRAARIALNRWDFEAELRQNAERTVERLDRARRLIDVGAFAKVARCAGRLAGALPALRRELFAFAPFGSSVIHGDLHPGNAVLRRGRRQSAVLLDWGRARIGSPLEDVSSWLQSLRGWEPVARRRHDTLFTAYLSARGMDRTLGSDLRTAYWLAGASNALSGSLLHHLSVMLDERVPSARRARAVYSALGWTRVLWRADASWR
jgi:hypothetical protein